MRKRDFLIKVNKPPRCHNPFSHCLLFAANSSGRSYFNLLAFLVYTLLWSRFSKPNLLDFVGMKRSRTEKSPWIKSKAKPGPKTTAKTTANTCAPETWLRHHRFPAKLKFACCQRWGRCYFIGSRLFKLTHSSVRAWYVYKSLEGENSHSFFDRIPSP